MSSIQGELQRSSPLTSSSLVLTERILPLDQTRIEWTD